MAEYPWIHDSISHRTDYLPLRAAGVRRAAKRASATRQHSGKAVALCRVVVFQRADYGWNPVSRKARCSLRRRLGRTGLRRLGRSRLRFHQKGISSSKLSSKPPPPLFCGAGPRLDVLLLSLSLGPANSALPPPRLSSICISLATISVV